MPDRPPVFVLDTHVWLWLMAGSPRLRPPVRDRLQRAVPAMGLHVSPISVWEVAMLERKGRISLGEDCATWVRDALAAPGVSLVPLSPDIAIASTRLPGEFHGDPADRILVATARHEAAVLVTADDAILAYAAAGHLRVLPAR